MTRTFNYILYSLGFLLFFSGNLSGQKTYKDYKKELKSLKGSRHLSKSFEFAEKLAENGDYANSLELMENGQKKSRSLGSSTQTVVLINKAAIIAREFPKDNDEYIEIILESVEDVLRSLIHEYTHYLQNITPLKRKMDSIDGYDESPYEQEAHKNEDIYINQLLKLFNFNS